MAKKSKEVLEVMKDRGILTEIPLSEIIKPDNYRKTMDPEELKALAESIKTHGLLQPIGVQTEGKGYKLIYGSRRAQAKALLGETTIKAYVYVNLTEMDMEVLAVVENLQRTNPTPFDEAMAVIKLHDTGKDSAQIGALLGVSALYVKRRMAIAKLPKKLKEAFVNGLMSIEHAAFVGTLTKDQQTKVAKEYSDGELFNKYDIGRAIKTNSLSGKYVKFNTKDPDLIPEMGPCTKCTFNTSVNELLKVEGVSSAICTNSPCYTKKEALGEVKAIIVNEYDCKKACIDSKPDAQEKEILKQLEEAGFEIIKTKPNAHYIAVNDEELYSENDEEVLEFMATEVNKEADDYVDVDDFTDLQKEKALEFRTELLKWIKKNKKSIFYSLDNRAFTIDLNDFKPFREVVESWEFKLDEDIDDDTDSESDEEDDDTEDYSKIDTSQYTDPSAVIRLQGKIDRNKQLVNEKLADFIKKDALLSFTGPYMMLDKEGLKLTTEEVLAYFCCLLDKLNGEAESRIHNLYAVLADKKESLLKNGKYGGSIFDHYEMAKFAMKNNAFNYQVLRAFIWSNAFDSLYRIKLDTPEDKHFDTKDAAIRGILSHEKTDGKTLREAAEKITADYDKKSVRLQERIDELKVKEPA